MTIEFQLDGLKLTASNGGPQFSAELFWFTSSTVVDTGGAAAAGAARDARNTDRRQWPADV